MILREMDDQATYVQQLQEDDGQVVLINQFNLAPEDAERFLRAWADDAAYMKQQPGYVQRGRLGVRPRARAGVPLTRVPGPRRPLPRQHRRSPARLQESRGPGHLRGLNGTIPGQWAGKQPRAQVRSGSDARGGLDAGDDNRAGTARARRSWLVYVT